MATQDVNFSEITAVNLNGVYVNQVIIDDETIWTGPGVASPIKLEAGVNVFSGTDVTEGQLIPEYTFEYDYTITPASEKDLEFDIKLRVFEYSTGNVISTYSVSNITKVSFNLLDGYSGKVQFSGNFGLITQSSTAVPLNRGAFIGIVSKDDQIKAVRIISPT